MNPVSKSGIASLQKGDEVMDQSNWNETLVDTHVTYTLELDGKIFLIENVPARVNEETGEYLFAPATVAHLQHIILEGAEPTRFIQVPVYTYSNSAA